MSVKRGMNKAVDTAIKGLKEISSPVNGKEDIARVASISANSTEIGNLRTVKRIILGDGSVRDLSNQSRHT